MKKLIKQSRRLLALFLSLALCASFAQAAAFEAEESPETLPEEIALLETTAPLEESGTPEISLSPEENMAAMDSAAENDGNETIPTGETGVSTGGMPDNGAGTDSAEAESDQVYAVNSGSLQMIQNDGIPDMIKRYMDAASQLCALRPINLDNMARAEELINFCNDLFETDFYGDEEAVEYFYGFCLDVFDSVWKMEEEYKELKATLQDDVITSADPGIQLTLDGGVLTITGSGYFSGRLLVNGIDTAIVNTSYPQFSYLGKNPGAIKHVVITGSSESERIEVSSFAFADARCIETLSVTNAGVSQFAFSAAFAPNAVITVENSFVVGEAFRRNPALSSVTLVNTELEPYVFEDSGIDSLSLRNMGVGRYAFVKAEINGEVDLSSVTCVAEHAFSDTGGTYRLVNLPADTVLGHSNTFTHILDGWKERMEGILSGRFALEPPKPVEEIAPDGWTSSQTGSGNSAAGLMATQITEEARWHDSGATAADVQFKAYYTEARQMDFLFVMDCSNSMSEQGDSSTLDAKFYNMQSKLLDVSRNLLSAEEYDCQVAFAGFGGEVDPIKILPDGTSFGGSSGSTFTSGGFTSDIAAAEGYITGAAPYPENTDYSLGLSKALDMVAANRSAGRNTTVIFISDGQPNKNDGIAEAARIKEAGAQIYAVLQSIPVEEYASASAVMESICTEGKFFTANDTDSFSTAVNDAIYYALKRYTMTWEINPAFTLDEESIVPSAGTTLEISRADGRTFVTWIAGSETFAAHTLRYRLHLNPVDGGYPSGDFPVNSGEAALAVNGGAAVNTVASPWLHRDAVYIVTYTDGVPGETVFADQTYRDLAAGTATPAFAGTLYREGYTFTGWSPAVTATVSGDAVYTAQWLPNVPEIPALPEFPVFPELPDPVEPDAPTIIPDNQTPLAEGDDMITITDEEVPLAGATGLNDTDHFAYVIGYEDGTVRPLNNISRAEAATIFFRLMTDEYRAANWSTVNDFTDVSAGGWYNNAISTCASAGALKGRGDGTKFDPNAPITRGEFAVIAARFLDESHVDDGKGDFADTADHWAAREIRLAAKAGWITGSGSKFRPDEPITRAEVMTIVNRMLDRTPDRDHMLSEMKRWTDNPEDAWYYEAVQEATNEHAYERDEALVEMWTELLPSRDWKALETEWASGGSTADPAAE